MAPRGKKTEAETEAAKVATQPAETSTPAGDLSTAPADSGDTTGLGQVDSAAAGTVVGAEVVTDAGLTATGTDGTGPATEDPAAAASTAAASEMLGAILDQAKATPDAPRERSIASATRWFPVADPVSLDGQDYDIDDDIELTFAQHESLSKAGVIDLPWAAGVEFL